MKTNISPAKLKWSENDFLFEHGPFFWGNFHKTLVEVYFFKAGGTSNPKAFSNMALLVAPSAGLPNNKKSTPQRWFFDPIILDPFGGLL